MKITTNLAPALRTKRMYDLYPGELGVLESIPDTIVVGVQGGATVFSPRLVHRFVPDDRRDPSIIRLLLPGESVTFTVE